MQQTTTSKATSSRESELERLEALYRRVGEEGERLALLRGPTGIGKSAILAEFRTRVRLGGGVVLEGRCTTGGAFAPFAEIVDRALRFLAEVGRAPTIDLSDLSCQNQCHELWYQHTGSTSHASATSSSDSFAVGDSMFAAAVPDIAAIEKRLRFFDALRGLLRDVAAVRPPVVMLHDLERADLGTLKLLGFFLDSRGPWADGVAPDRQLSALFVASVDAGAAKDHKAIARLGAHDTAEIIEVSELDVEGVRAYLQSPDTVARVLERTGGSPEAIDLLLDGDPLTPEGRVERRLARLSDETRALVEALSVLERPTDLELVARIAGQAPNHAAHRELDASQLVSRVIEDGAILFTFAREADRERAYALLADERRQALHRACMNAYLERPGHREEAANHALLSGDVDRLVPLALDAARSLAASHAQGEAALLLERVLDAVESAEGRKESRDESQNDGVVLRGQLVDLYRAAGDYKRGLGHAEAVRAASPECPEATRRVGELLTLAGRLDDAAEVLERGRLLAAASRDVKAETEVEALLAELHYQRASHVEAREWATKALASARAQQDLMLMLSAQNTLGKLALVERDDAAAALLFEENRRLAEDAGLRHQEAQALTNLGVALLRRQDLLGAEEAFDKAIGVALLVNDTRDRAIATENLAVLAHLRRDYGRAQSYYHEAVALLKRLGNRAMLARVAINLGELYLSLGEHSRARTLSEFSTHMGGTGLPPSVRGEGLILRGRIDAARGHLTDARASFEAALATYQRLGEARVVDAIMELARLSLEEGDVTRATAHLADLPVQESPKRAARVALLAADIERAAGADVLGAARRAAELAQNADDEEVLLPALVCLARAECDAGDLEAAKESLASAERVDDVLTSRVPEEALGGWDRRPIRGALLAVRTQLESAWNASRRSSPVTARRSSSVPPPKDVPDVRFEAWSRRYPELAGRSTSMAAVLSLLDKVAPTDALVLVRGESGTGKELIADALHENSDRRDKPLVKVNCAALVETLLLSELFGHERGAFTGASARKKGRFELADGGTIFLDEIGDISAKTQVALLRVLQERAFERVGGTQPIKVNVRIIAATHRDLEAMVRQGTFREDLYYRLRGVMFEMPPLRKRPGDLPILADRLLRRIAEERGEAAHVMSPEALTLLSGHNFPGNVRELENILRSATLFADTPRLTPQDFAAFSGIFGGGTPPAEDSGHEGGVRAVETSTALEDLMYDRVRGGNNSLLELKKVIERECIMRALSETDGNITRAASLLGMKRPRLSQLVKHYGLNSNPGEQ